MHKLLVSTAVVTVAAAVAVPAFAAKTITVKATDSDHWSPRSIPLTKNLRKGDTVKFTWRTEAPHNVRKTSGKGTVKNGNPPRRNGTATFKVPAKGTYKFICDVHPLTMKITVRATG
jgi:plastocyanin